MNGNTTASDNVSVEQSTEDSQVNTADRPAEGEVADQPADGEEASQPAEGEGADRPVEGEGANQPAEGEEANRPAEGEAADQPAEGEGTDQPAEGEGTDQPAEGEGDDRPAEGEGIDQPAEGEEASQPAEGEEANQPAEGEGTGDFAEGQAQPAATVDLSGVERYPLSLRELLAQAKAAAEPAEETAEPTEDAASAESEGPVEQEESDDAARGAELPVAEWTIEYDEALFAVTLEDDDYAVMPLASFDSAAITVNGFELTLTHCRLPEAANAGAQAGQPAVSYPAQHFEGSTAVMKVIVDAPEGALPEGTIMRVQDVEDAQTLSDIEDTVSEDFVEVTRVHAVDISFWYKDNEIEPLEALSVVMSVPEVEAQEEAVVVHVDNDGATEVVNSQGEAQQGATDVAVEMPANEQAAEAGEQPSGGEMPPTGTVGFEADSFSVYAVVVAKTIETKYIDAKGDTWNISLGYGKEANIPADATLRVSEVTSEAYLEKAVEALAKRVTEAYFFDIAILDADGNEIQPDAPVQVNITLAEGAEAVSESEDQYKQDSGDPAVCAVHITDTDTAVIKATETKEAVTFDAPSFSVWGVVYTVDFHYTVNGQTFDYGIPGGDCASLRTLLPALGIVADDPGTEADEVNDFVAAVSDVTFSTSELVLVDKVEENTTVGALRAALGVESEYSAAMTEEDRAAIDGKALAAPDWALFSLKPFTSDETLTVAMDNGDSFAVAVTDAQITTHVIAADGTAYKITVTFGPEAGIPVDAQLKVREVDKDTVEWNAYCSQAKQATGMELESPVDYSRFFDIEIWSGDQKIEPDAAVSVSIELEDTPNTRDELKVVHFVEDGPVVMPSNVTESTEAQSDGVNGETDCAPANVRFETDSFSVYGIITVPTAEPESENDLAGRSFKMKYGNDYVTSESVKDGKSLPQHFTFSSQEDDAAVWQFESAGQDGYYYISTIERTTDDDTVTYEKKYFYLERYGEDSPWANASLSDEPQAYWVEKEGNNYYFSTVLDQKGDPQTFYLRYRYGVNGGTNGISGQDVKNTNESKFSLSFQNQTVKSGGRYMLLVKYDGSYYIIMNDGTLYPVNDPEHIAGQFEVDDPMVWSWNGENLYHRTVETGFNGSDLASDFFWRYMDPEVDIGYTDENEDNTPTKYADSGKVVIEPRPLAEYIQVNYQDNKISSKLNPYSYIGIARGADGKLRIVGNRSAEDAAEIYFTELVNDSDFQYNNQHHTVNHIDIAIEGHATISTALAYGTYYYKDGTGSVKTLIVTRQNPVMVELAMDVDITKDDVRNANVTAYTIDENDVHRPIDNAFIITGFSGNAKSEAGGSPNQTRIEGVFKVADLPPMSGNDNWHTPAYTDNNGVPQPGMDSKQAICDARKARQIYYTVSTTKEIEFDLKYNNFALYETYEDAAAGSPNTVKKGAATVTLGNSFSYWDKRNECPPLTPTLGGRDEWLNGEIAWVGTGAETGSGMDFQLGTIDKDKYGVLAVEITKFIMDTSNTPITPREKVYNRFKIYHLNTSDQNAVDSVADMDVNAYSHGYDALREGSGSYDYDKYGYVKTKTATVGIGGTGSVYDYDIDAGMVYIEEDTSDKSLPKVIEDVNGQKWYYKYTRIETEYVWRGNGNSGMHVSQDYTLDGQQPYNSHPEVLGGYKDVNGYDCYNGFLEYYVYNIYEQEPIDVPVKKVWKFENGSLAPGLDGVTIDVELGRYHLIEDTENPATGTISITHSVTGRETYPGGSYEATINLWQGNKQVRSFPYDPGNATQTLSDVPQGVYTLEVVESLNGYNGCKTSIDGITGRKKVVSVETGKTTNVAIDTVLSYKAPPQKITLTVKVINKVSNQVYNQVGAPRVYSFPAGETVVFTLYRPSAKFNSFECFYEVDDNNSYPTIPAPDADKDKWTYVEQDWEYTLGNTNTQIELFHNMEESDFKLLSVALKNQTATAQETEETTPQEGDDGIVTPSVPAHTSYVTVTGGVPETQIPGMKYVDDAEFQQFVTLGNGIWEDVFTELPVADENGYEYVYYIRSAKEYGTNATPAIEKMISMGDTTLEITNTIPDEKPKITLRKVDNNGQPLNGVAFQFVKDGDMTHAKTLTISDPSGRLVIEGWDDDEGLPDGQYSLNETGAPEGYKLINGNITFAVQNKAVTEGTTPVGVTFDGESYTYTITNEPEVQLGNLKIVKRWQDIHGNVLESHPASATLKLLQLVKNEGEKHRITVNITDSGANKTWTRTTEGRGTATLKWKWNQYTAQSNCTLNVNVDGEDTSCVNIVSDNQQGGYSTLTLYDDGSGNDVTVSINIYNNGYHAIAEYGTDNHEDKVETIQLTSTTRPGSGYTLTGGSKNITLPNDNKWYADLVIDGDGKLSESSPVLPATYNHRPCRYIIMEESLPEGYTVTYSDNNTLGVASGDNAALTAYNRLIQTDLSLIKVDQTNHQIKLGGAQFSIYKINPEQTGVAYLPWSYAYYPEGQNYLVTNAETGKLTFNALDLGCYEIEELQTPSTNYGKIGDGKIYIKVSREGIFVIEKDLNKRPIKWHERRNDSLIMVNRGGEITIGDPINYGALLLTKLVTVNDAEPVASNAHVTDGTYTFSITGKDDVNNFAKDESHTLKITFADGKATSYQIDNNLPVTVPSDVPMGNWTVLVPNLKPGTYIITETDTGNLKFKSAQVGSNEAVASDGVEVEVVAGDTDGTQTAQVVYTNNGDVVDIEASKIWKNGDTDVTATLQNASVTFTLESSTDSGANWAKYTDLTTELNGYGSEVSLPLTGKTGEDAWKVKWTNLPKKTADGVQIEYRVTESGAKLNEIDMATVPSKEAEQYITTDTGTYAVVCLENPLPETGIKVTKDWKMNDVSIAWPANTTVTVGLYRTTGDNAPEAVEGKTLVLSADNSEDAFSDLPVYDNSGAEYTYSVREISVSTVNPATQENVTVNTADHTDAAVTVGGMSITIVEAAIEQNSDTSEGAAPYAATITNTLPEISLEIIKVENGTNKRLNDARFQMTRKLPGEDTFSAFEHPSFALDGENKQRGPFTVNETATISGLLPGTYRLDETKAPNGYIIMTGSIEFTINADGTVTYDATSEVNRLNTMVVSNQKNGSTDASFTIGNAPGVALPNTGGSGTALIYALGVGLLALAALGFILRARKENQ